MAAHRITLVRHGETQGQSSIRYYGATDVPLSTTGERQMRRVGEALSQARFDRVFSSALRRTREAAGIIVPDLPAVPVAALNEIHFGRWEGWTREEIAARDPELYARWRAQPRAFAYPDGDDRGAFAARVSGGLARLLDEHPPGEWLMVLHRGVIAVALEHLLGAAPPPPVEIALGSMHVVASNGDGWIAEQLDVVP
jgi:broad specificity phosphatase PhoE